MKLKLPPWSVLVPSPGSSEFTVVCRSGWWPTCPRSPRNKMVIKSSVAIVELVIVTFLWHIFEHKCILSHALSFSVLLLLSLICNSKWCYFSDFTQVLMSHNLFVLGVAAEKIPGLSREGSPHSATSNKVSNWQEPNTSLCVSFIRVILFNSLYIMDFMCSLCTGTGCIWNLSNPILPKKCLVPLKFVNGF